MDEARLKDDLATMAAPRAPELSELARRVHARAKRRTAAVASVAAVLVFAVGFSVRPTDAPSSVSTTSEMASPSSSTDISPIAAANKRAEALPPVDIQCSAGDEPTRYAYDAENGGFSTPEGVLGLAVADRERLPVAEFRRSAGTSDAVQFVFPAIGPTKAVVVVTKAGSGWRVHSLDGCKSLTLLPGEADAIPPQFAPEDCVRTDPDPAQGLGGGYTCSK